MSSFVQSTKYLLEVIDITKSRNHGRVVKGSQSVKW